MKSVKKIVAPTVNIVFIFLSYVQFYYFYY